MGAVHGGVKSAMRDKNVQNAAYNSNKRGGNDQKSNAKVFGALAKNKQVQGAAYSVAKDKNVQKAAWNGAKKHGKGMYQAQNNQQQSGYKAKPQLPQQQQGFYEEKPYYEEMEEGPRDDYNPFDD